VARQIEKFKKTEKNRYYPKLNPGLYDVHHKHQLQLQDEVYSTCELRHSVRGEKEEEKKTE
jgi:hypothetical protein